LKSETNQEPVEFAPVVDAMPVVDPMDLLIFNNDQWENVPLKDRITSNAVTVKRVVKLPKREPKVEPKLESDKKDIIPRFYKRPSGYNWMEHYRINCYDCWDYSCEFCCKMKKDQPGSYKYRNNALLSIWKKRLLNA